MMKKKLFIPITVKIFLYFMPVVLILFLSTAYYVYSNSKNTFEVIVNNQFTQAINMAENHLELLKQMNMLLVNNFAEEHDFLRYIEMNSTSSVLDLITHKITDLKCDEIIYLNNNLDIVAEAGSMPFQADTLKNLEIAQKTLRTQKQYTRIVRQYDSFVLYSSAPVVVNGKGKGVVLIGFVINNTMMKNIKKETPLEFSIVGDRILAASSFPFTIKTLNALPMPYLDYLWLLEYPDKHYETLINNEHYLLSARKLKNLDGVTNASILMAYPSTKIRLYEQDIKQTIVSALLILLLLFFLITYFFTNKFRKLLKSMILQTKNIKNGNYNERLELKTNDEFEILAENFNEMTESLEEKSKVIVEYTNSLEEKVRLRTQELEELAMRDTLTGLYNRVKFNSELDMSIKKVKRYNETYSIVIIDIDDFKAVNDTYGHIVGDYALVTLAQIFSDRMRDTDIFARWGGEEFVMLLPSTQTKDAYLFVESLRETLKSYSFEYFTRLTCSFGITSIVAEDTEQSLLERADEALYISKNSGKDKATIL